MAQDVTTSAEFIAKIIEGAAYAVKLSETPELGNLLVALEYHARLLNSKEIVLGKEIDYNDFFRYVEHGV